MYEIQRVIAPNKLADDKLEVHHQDLKFCGNRTTIITQKLLDVMQHTLEGSTPADILDYRVRDLQAGAQVHLSYLNEDKQLITEWMDLNHALTMFPSEVEKFIKDFYCSRETHSAQIAARNMWRYLKLYPPLNRKRKNRA